MVWPTSPGGRILNAHNLRRSTLVPPLGHCQSWKLLAKRTQCRFALVTVDRAEASMNWLTLSSTLFECRLSALTNGVAYPRLLHGKGCQCQTAASVAVGWADYTAPLADVDPRCRKKLLEWSLFPLPDLAVRARTTQDIGNAAIVGTIW